MYRITRFFPHTSSMNSMEILARIIHLNLTQVWVAEQVGISQGRLHNIGTGERPDDIKKDEIMQLMDSVEALQNEIVAQVKSMRREAEYYFKREWDTGDFVSAIWSKAQDMQLPHSWHWATAYRANLPYIKRRA